MVSHHGPSLPLTLNLSLLSTLLLLLRPSTATPVTGTGIMSNLLGIGRSSSWGSLSPPDPALDPVTASIAASRGYEWGPECPGIIDAPENPGLTSRRLHNGRTLSTYPTVEKLCAAAHWGGDASSNVGGVCVVIPGREPFAGMVTGAPYGDPLLYEDERVRRVCRNLCTCELPLGWDPAWLKLATAASRRAGVMERGVDDNMPGAEGGGGAGYLFVNKDGSVGAGEKGGCVAGQRTCGDESQQLPVATTEQTSTQAYTRRRKKHWGEVCRRKASSEWCEGVLAVTTPLVRLLPEPSKRAERGWEGLGMWAGASGEL